MLARIALLLVAAFVPFVDVLLATPQQRKPRKVAFLVGVGDFKHDPKSLGDSPKKDVTELAKELEASEFEIVTLTDSQATKSAIESRFQALLDGGGKPEQALGNKDLLLVAVCSHGFTFDVTGADGMKKSEPYLAAHDTRLGHTNTMVSLNGLIEGAKSFAPTALFLVDACREVPLDPNRGVRGGIEGKQVTLPKRTAVLFACGEGQLSHQSEKANGHGLFTFAVLKTIRAGGGANWDRLVAGVKETFQSDEVTAMLPAGKVQTPVLATGELGFTALLTKKPDGEMAKRGEPAAGKEEEFEIADGMKMRFCWIPKGKATLGSPKTEMEREGEEVEHEYECKGFWLGKYEVTQEEWKAVMKTNPSAFASTGSDVECKTAVMGMKTERFPVERVSWFDVQPFLEKLNNQPGAKTAFGVKGRFVLPREDEWEYAARGGKENKFPFYWGSELNGTQANCSGNIFPYGTTRIGDYLKRTCAVDDTTRNYPKHPWGLMHIIGNVREWCEDKKVYKSTFGDKSDEYRYLRGGAWGESPIGCRTARRYWYWAEDRRADIGFRVAYRLDESNAGPPTFDDPKELQKKKPD